VSGTLLDRGADHQIERAGRLDDTPARDYSRKLQLFNQFAEPELREAIASLHLTRGMHVLDAGCGTGEALPWFREELGANATVVGVDLSAAHAAAARARKSSDIFVAQADLQRPPFARASFDLIWSVNTINHLHDARGAAERLASLLRPGGRLVLGQSSLLPDMYFAWDARLERVVTEAVRQYYRDRYHLDERDLAAVRGLLGVMRGAKLNNVQARTVMIERVSPLKPHDEAYLYEAIFRDTWGQRLRPYLSDDDYEELLGLCDPASPGFALRRPDFHFLQSFTLMIGQV
jgi:SAM-dependent methyltransferase